MILLVVALIIGLGVVVITRGDRQVAQTTSRPTLWLPGQPRELPDRAVAAILPAPERPRVIKVDPPKPGPPVEAQPMPPGLRLDGAYILQPPKKKKTGSARGMSAGGALIQAGVPGERPRTLKASAAAMTSTAVTKPGPVTGLQATGGNAQASFSWTMPADDGGAPLSFTTIRIYKASNNASAGNVTVNVPATTATVTGLTVGVAYYAKVTVTNTSALTSTLVQSAGFTPAAGPQPAPPATVTAVAGTGKVTVNWTAPVEDGGSPITGYTVTAYTSSMTVVGTPVATPTTTLTAEVTGLTNGTGYYFGVAATNSAGTGPRQLSAFTRPAGPPGAPGTPQVHPADGQLFATWAAPTNNGGAQVTAYTVTAYGPQGPAAQGVVQGNAAVLTGLLNGVAYTVKVSASNPVAAGPESAASAPATPNGNGMNIRGGLKQIPPRASQDGLSTYWHQKYDPAISGNGRYVVYLAQRDPDLPTGFRGLARYDRVTGAKVRVSVASDGVTVEYGYRYAGSTDDSVSISYDGNRIAWLRDGVTVDETIVSVRDVNAQTTTIAMTYTETGNGLADMKLKISADGSAVYQMVDKGSGLPGETACSDYDVYRYDMASGGLSHVDFDVPIPGNLPGVTGVTCVNLRDGGLSYSVSPDGNRIAINGFLSFQCSDTPVNRCNRLSMILVADHAGGGWTSRAYSAEAQTLYWLSTDKYYVTPELWEPKILNDGSILVRQTSVLTGNFLSPAVPVLRWARIGSLDAPLTPGAGIPSSIGIKSISGNGQTAIASWSVGGLIHLFALDIASSGLQVLSQYDGALAIESTTTASDQLVDDSGATVVFDTDSTNLLGLPGDYGPTNVVIQGIDPALYVNPAQSGCLCLSALGLGAPLQGTVGDPVNTATGAFTETVNDVTLRSGGVPLTFQRTYTSDRTTSGPMGRGWAMSYDMSVNVSGETATVTADDGGRAVYTRMPDGTYQPPSGVTSALRETSTGFTLTTAQGQIFTFDTAGRLAASTDQAGRGLTFAHTGALLTSITDTGGRTATLTYTGGLLTGLTLADGRSAGYAYTNGNLTAVTGLDGRTRTYAYDAGHRLTTVTDPDGRIVVTNTYDPASGRVTGQVTEGGRTSTLTWNAETGVSVYTTPGGGTVRDHYTGNVLTRRVDADGGITTYGYDSRLNRTSVTDPTGRTTEMTYDAAGRLLTRTVNDVTVSWTYDGAGNTTSHTDGLGNRTEYTYDSDGRLKTKRNALGRTTTLSYDGDGNLTGVEWPGGGTETYTYDGNGNLASATDPTGNTTTYTRSPAGQLLTMTDAAGKTTSYSYDGAGRILTVTDPTGRVTTNGYDASGNLASIEDPAGATTAYTYDSANRLTRITDPLGGATSYTYDADGNQTSRTDPTGAKTTLGYDPNGLLAATVSARGNAPGANPAFFTTTYTYDGNGVLLKSVNPLGGETAYEYDPFDRPVKITDPLGNVTTMTYDANGNLLQVRDPEGGTVTSAYDAVGRLSSTTDANGKTTSYTYDADGNRLTEVTPSGARTSWTYDPAGRVLAEIDPRGNRSGATAADFTTSYAYTTTGLRKSITLPGDAKTTFGYDDAGNLTTTTSALGDTTTVAYDAAGRVWKVTDARGGVTTTEYDAAGRPTTVVDPLGGHKVTAYDPAGRITSITTPRGSTTTFAYDADGNRTSAARPGNAVTTTAYDALDRPVVVTDPLGFQRTTGYDAAGRTVSVTNPENEVLRSHYDRNGLLTTSVDPLGNTTTFTHDPTGKLLSRIAPLGQSVSWTYDADGRMSKQTDPRGKATTFSYDAAGHLIESTDPLGHVTAYGFDAAGRLTSVTDPLGKVTRYGYNKDGDQTSVTDAEDNETTYEYGPTGLVTSRTDAKGHTTGYDHDAAGRLVTVTDPLGESVAYTYDADGNQTGVTNARNQQITTTYDARNQPTAVTYSDGTPGITRTFDAAGRLVTTGNGSGTRTLTYDKVGRLLGDGSFTYAYDDNGQVTSRTSPGGAQVISTYNANGWRTGQSAAGVGTTYGYDAAGNLTTQTATGSQRTIAYDSTGAVTSVEVEAAGSDLASWQITRDAARRPTSVAAELGGDTTTTAYGYDPTGRLLRECSTTGGGGCGSDNGAVPGTVYTYDKVGNRLTKAESSHGNAPLTTTYTYDAADRLTGQSGPDGTVAHTYDADGNQIGQTGAGATVTRAFDAVNRLTAQNDSTFTYDPFGNRSGVTTGTLTQRLHWDTNNDLPLLAQVDGADQRIDYSYNPLGQAATVSVGGDPRLLFSDWQGNAAAVTAPDGTPLGAGPAAYGAFGTSTTDIAGLGSGLLGADGQLLNPDGSTYHLRARQYDPATGRFLSRDPITQPFSEPYLSAYVYADDRPTVLRDPSGLDAEDIGGYIMRGDKVNHDFAVGLAYEQLVAAWGVQNVYADNGPGFYGPIGQLLMLPGKSQSSKGNGRPDLAVRNVPVDNRLGWWVYEMKSATQASSMGTSFGNAIDSVAQLQDYIDGLPHHPKSGGMPARAGDPILPDSAWNPASRAIVTIFNATDFPTYGRNYQKPFFGVDQSGLIYYSVFRPDKDRVNEENTAKEQPAIQQFLDDMAMTGLPSEDVYDQLYMIKASASGKCPPGTFKLDVDLGMGDATIGLLVLVGGATLLQGLLGRRVPPIYVLAA